MTGADASDVVFAVAEVGDGRVAVFSHGSYPDSIYKHLKIGENEEIGSLCKNLVPWLLHDRELDVEKMVGVKERTDLSSDILENGELIIWIGEADQGENFIPNLLGFLEKGGAVVCGATPWGFLQLFPGRSLESMEMSNFVQNFGISFTADCLHLGAGLTVEKNMAQFSNLRSAILECSPRIRRDFSKNEHGGFGVIAKSLPYLPLDGSDDILEVMAQVLDGGEEPIPTKESPCTDKKSRALIVIADFLRRRGHLADNPPGIERFPGIPTGEVTTLDIGVPLDRSEYHPLGLYAPPGSPVMVFCKSEVPKGASIIVGCHTDVNVNCKTWMRYPNISFRYPLSSGENYVTNIYGGGLYLHTTAPADNTILGIHVEGVIRAPFVNTTSRESLSEWEMRREFQVPWADLEDEHIMITLPSAWVKNIPNIRLVMKFWNTVVATHNELKGTDPRQRHKEWVVYDVQPHNGYMHAGNPIVATMNNPIDCKDKLHESILDIDRLRTEGDWGLFHELGHNMQDGAWCFDGTIEVTVNIFTLHAMERIVFVDPWHHPWLRGQFEHMKSFLETKCGHQAWKENPGVALGLFAQLIFRFGFQPFNQFFRQYLTMPESDLPKSNEDKINQWIIRFSRIVGMNILPVFDFWAVPHTVEKELEGLPLFLPDDDISRLTSRLE